MKNSSWYTTVSPLCPFYQRETRESICCSGISDGNTVRISYANMNNKNEHKKSYCERRYQMCPLYQMLRSQNKQRGEK